MRLAARAEREFEKNEPDRGSQRHREAILCNRAAGVSRRSENTFQGRFYQISRLEGCLTLKLTVYYSTLKTSWTGSERSPGNLPGRRFASPFETPWPLARPAGRLTPLDMTVFPDGSSNLNRTPARVHVQVLQVWIRSFVAASMTERKNKMRNWWHELYNLCVKYLIRTAADSASDSSDGSRIRPSQFSRRSC